MALKAFATMEVHDTTFGPGCRADGTECYWRGGQGEDVLKPGQILRVHTGSRRFEGTLSAEDRKKHSLRTGATQMMAAIKVPPGGPARVAPESGRSPAGRVAGRGRTGTRTLSKPATRAG